MGCLQQLHHLETLTESVIETVKKFTAAYYSCSAKELDSDASAVTALAAAEVAGGGVGLAGHIGGAIGHAMRAAEEGVEFGARAAGSLGGTLAVVGGLFAVADLAVTANQEPPGLSKLQEAKSDLMREQKRIAVVERDITKVV